MADPQNGQSNAIADSAAPVPGAAGASPPTYDASQGFHDIKPLPQFSPFPLHAVLLGALLLLFAAVLFWFLRRRKQSESAAAPPPPPPEKTALNEIRRLALEREQRQIEVRKLAVALSLAVRNYLEADLRFPACDLTPREINNRILSLLRRSLPTVPREKLEHYRVELNTLLAFCERAAFGTNAEAFYPLESSMVGEQLRRSEALVRQLSLWLKKELERKTGVVAQSKISADYQQQPAQTGS